MFKTIASDHWPPMLAQLKRYRPWQPTPVTPDGALPPKASEKSCRLIFMGHGLMNAALDLEIDSSALFRRLNVSMPPNKWYFRNMLMTKCCNLRPCMKQQHVSAWSNCKAWNIQIDVLCTGCNGKLLFSQGWEPKPIGQTDRMAAAWVYMS